nr:unnamed protein product [Callosobruchus chinensis]
MRISFGSGEDKATKPARTFRCKGV